MKPMKPLTSDQKAALVELGSAYPDPVPARNKSTAHQSLARKGLARKVPMPRSGFCNVILTADGVTALHTVAPDTFERVNRIISGLVQRTEEQ